MQFCFEMLVAFVCAASRCRFNLKSRKYSAADDYYLVIANENGMQVTRENFTIDIAFAVDDFDFFD